MSSNDVSGVSSPFSFVLVAPRVGPKWIDRFAAVGIVVNARSKARNEEIAAAHAAEAKTVGLDGFRAGRTDAIGTKQADSGRPLFGWEGAKYEAMTLGALRGDLAKTGYVLVNANLVQKEGDRMAKLYVRFEPRQTGTPAEMSLETSNLIDEVLTQVYKNLHVFRNPNGSATVNPLNMVPADQRSGITDPRSLRMSVDGSFENVKVRLPAATPTAPTPPAPTTARRPASMERPADRGSSKRW